MKSKSGNSFLVPGIVFLVIGISGNNAFRAIGIAFLAIGIAQLVREKRANLK